MRYFLEFIIEYEGKFASTEEKRLNYLNEYTRLLDTQEYVRTDGRTDGQRERG